MNMTARQPSKGKRSKGQDAEDAEEELVRCTKCGCTDFGAFPKDVGGKTEYMLKCRNCGAPAPYQ